MQDSHDDYIQYGELSGSRFVPSLGCTVSLNCIDVMMIYEILARIAFCNPKSCLCLAGRQHSVALRAWESSDSHVDWFRATQSAIKRKLFNEKSGKQCRYVRSSSVKMGSLPYKRSVDKSIIVRRGPEASPNGRAGEQSEGASERPPVRPATAGGPSKSDVDGGEQSTTPRTADPHRLTLLRTALLLSPCRSRAQPHAHAPRPAFAAHIYLALAVFVRTI